jgi:hypothetical protein
MKSLFTSLLFLVSGFFFSSRAQDLEKINFKKPFEISGNINFTSESYSVRGLSARRQPFSWVISGAPNVKIFGFQLPFNFLFSNFQNRYYQPFNQYGVSPKYKWIKLHAGYRNISFSPYTLAGFRMLGGGFELTPGKLRMGFMYGQLNRSTAIDSVQFGNPLAFRPTPTYTRMAYAAKLGVGTANNYFDLSYLKGWDVVKETDAAAVDSIAPAENTALGFSWKLTFFKKLFWQTDLGVSVYTNDTRSELVVDSTSKKIERQLLGDWLQARASTQYLTAGETRFGYQDKYFGLSVSYKRIDPDYKSMGAYFFQSDIQQVNISPNLRLLKGKLFISGSGGIQEDNLSKLKLATSKRVIGNGNVSWNPSSRFGINVNYSNYGITRNPFVATPSSELFKQVSQSFSVVPYLNFLNDRHVQTYQLVTSYQSLNNPVQSINTAADQQTTVGSFIYGINWVKSTLSLNGSINYNNTELPQGAVGSYGAGLGAGIGLLKKRMQLGANLLLNNNYFNGLANGNTVNGTVNISMPLKKKQNLQFQLIYLKNKSNDETVIKSFSEATVRLSYGVSF